MKKLHSKYQINIQGLADKRHEFEFEGGDEFFESFEQDIIEKGQFEAKVSLEKSSRMLMLEIGIKGVLTLVCDRSLEEFDEAIDLHENYVYKFGDDYEEVSEDMEIIPFGAAEINLAKNIFEYICLAIPMKKLHPDYRTEEDTVDFLFRDSKAEMDKTSEAIDPRWAALEKIKKDL